MGFSTNYNDIPDDYGLIPEGEYEVVIRNIEERTTKKGAVGINLSLVIRNDVEQKYKDRYLFHTLWKRKEPTEADMQVQGYSFKQIMILAKAAKLPSGKAYENVRQLCGDLLKRPLRVTVEHEINDYNGKTRENIRYINESKFPECKHVFKEKKSAAASGTANRKPREQFAADNTSFGSLDDFEEILSDTDVPF
jgi:hypothetical protein